MLPLKEKDRPIVKKLLEAGCCARCVLRFCCLGVQSAYRQSYEDTAKELCAFISDSENNKSQNAAVLEQHTEDPPRKKIKMDAAETDVQSEGDSAVVPAVMEEGDAKPADSDVCAVCLGVLQEFCDEAYAIKHSCWLHVKKEVREKSICLDKDDVIQVKEAFKWTMQGLMSKELGGVPVVTKISRQTEQFEVGVGFTHPETDSDCHFLADICSDCFRPTKNKQNVFTRMAVVKALEKVSNEKFLKKFPCPPTRPARKCIAQEVQCLHVSVFVAGRYNKFSRTLPQTPWVIDGERRMESSVEELIAAPLFSSFRAEGFNFSSSGREDVDVRTLGNGRPFALELLNPHRARFNKAEVRQLQETINQSSDKIRVRDLQIVSRDAMGHMKEGEEDKTKSYTALIWTQKAINKDDITFLEETKELKLAQKTPLRVLHRRPLAVRERVIHTMSTCFLDTHHFHLKLLTQAGTYIKEFVHGDFGRTKPNLCDLLKTETDILELDVDSVDVDWPPSIPE
ncbi:tRNA pseudouridine synthase Pus10 [Oncorhynchus tshawytscha]|uniref:tRNA pseudouridine synthase Pus10 n=1 Tax=Oncorhynchus tshawytscha TaxID=74940 RepID=A0A8C8FGJ2_ONCTS|nr:tRNA pseudouridine synthase Pus10 [Oncorhynchus tshawytscha]XP_042166849.1 tRNA pseudouridine synthase Pus10 [Oncorhynchus tshawytscha]